jgi:hypothetical protein
MPDLWEGDMDASDFALPGDEAKIATIQESTPEPAATTEEAPEPNPVSEAARLLRSQRDKSEEPEQAEGEPTELSDTEETPQEQAERLFANKYQSAEELEKGYQELQARLSQRDERAALADQYEQYFAQQQQYAQQQQHAAPGDWETMIEEDPARAAQLAAQQQNPYAFERAMEAWDEISPGTPQVWYDNQVLQAQNQHTNAQMQQIAAQEREREVGYRVNQLASEFPDFPDRIPQMQQIAAQYPYELRALVEGTPDEVASAAKSLYLKSLGLDRDTLVQTAQETVRKLALDEQAAVEAAGVVSASRTNPEKPASAAEAIAASWADEDRRFEGWNIGN